MKTPHRLLAAALLAGLALVVPQTALAHDGEQHEAAVTGTLRIEHTDDFLRGRARYDYELLTRRGKIELEVPKLPAGVSAGMRVRATGELRGNTLFADSGDVEPTSSSEPVGDSLGVRKTAVILFNFSDDTRQPFTTDYARSVMFTSTTSVNAYYKEQSFGRVSFTGKSRSDGDVFGWYTIGYSSSTCDPLNWSSAAYNAAVAAGVDLTGYDHYVYAFPQVSSCGWAGMAYVPGSVSWINGAFNLRVVGHELGHNLGVHHAASLRCTNSSGQVVSISSSCTMSEYGDPFDVMGAGTFHTNNWHKAKMSWFDSGNVKDVTSSGTYSVVAQETLSTSPQVLRVARGSTGDYYYLEFRQPYGFDTFASSDPVVNGISIRLGKGYDSITQSRLIDATPSTYSFLDAALASGATFSDGDYKITVTTKTVSSLGASVEVKLGSTGDTEAPSAPSGLTQTAATETSVSLAWTAASDNVGVAGYGVYRGGVGPANISSTKVTMKNLKCGTSYTFSVDAFDAAGNRSSKVSITGKTSACSSDTQAPSAPSSLTGEALSGPKVALSWKASTDNVGVAGYRVYRDGTQVGTSSTTSYTDSKVAASTSYTYTVKAYDAAGNVSAASNSVTVKTGSSSDTEAPTMPDWLSVSGVTRDSATLGWQASTDNVGVAGYSLYLNGTRVANVTTLSYTFTGLWCDTTYKLSVDAYDAAGNRSAQNWLNVVTSPC